MSGKVAVKISTYGWEWAWGNKPRGRGAWYFEFNAHHWATTIHEPAPPNLFYSEACAWARARAKVVGAEYIALMS